MNRSNKPRLFSIPAIDAGTFLKIFSAFFVFLAVLTASSVSGQDGKTELGEEITGKGISSSLGPSACQDGEAAGFTCSNVDLVSFMSREDLGAVGGVGLNDAWGWTDPDTGKRYALVAREDGVAFVDLSAPEVPIYVGQLLKPTTAQTNVWRDIKVDGYYAFIVADGSPSRRGPHGMQVFDLRRLREHTGTAILFDADAHYTDFSVTHNLVVNEETDRAYIVGSRVEGRGCGPGLLIVDISNPLSPTFSGCFNDPATGRSSDGYTHDAQCVVYRGPDTTHQGREICIGANETAISVADVTDADDTFAISHATYPTASYVHQGWLTEDHRYFVQNDEGDERIWESRTRTFIWDMIDLDDPVLLTEFVSDVVSIDHNLYVRGDFVYQANYTSGLRILDIANPAQPRIAGWFDTYPAANEVSFRGAWTAYPFPDSDLVIVTGRSEGLFVLRPSNFLATKIGSVQATALENAIRVEWMMTKESNLESMRVEQKRTDGSFTLLDEILADGTEKENQSYELVISIEEGVHLLRVSAIGSDGGIMSSDEVVVSVLAGTHLLQPPYPNPLSTSMTSSLVVSEFQDVKATIVDVSGREVSVLYEGALSHDVQLFLNYDMSSLVGGVYFLRVVGETFSDTRKLVVAH